MTKQKNGDSGLAGQSSTTAPESSHSWNIWEIYHGIKGDTQQWKAQQAFDAASKDFSNLQGNVGHLPPNGRDGVWNKEDRWTMGDLQTAKQRWLNYHEHTYTGYPAGVSPLDYYINHFPSLANTKYDAINHPAVEKVNTDKLDPVVAKAYKSIAERDDVLTKEGLQEIRKYNAENIKAITGNLSVDRAELEKDLQASRFMSENYDKLLAQFQPYEKSSRLGLVPSVAEKIASEKESTSPDEADRYHRMSRLLKSEQTPETGPDSRDQNQIATQYNKLQKALNRGDNIKTVQDNFEKLVDASNQDKTVGMSRLDYYNALRGDVLQMLKSESQLGGKVHDSTAEILKIYNGRLFPDLRTKEGRQALMDEVNKDAGPGAMKLEVYPSAIPGDDPTKTITMRFSGRDGRSTDYAKITIDRDPLL